MVNVVNSFALSDLMPVVVIATFLSLTAGTLTFLLLSTCLLLIYFMCSVKPLVNIFNGFFIMNFAPVVVLRTFLPLIINTLIFLLSLSCPLSLCFIHLVRHYNSLS